MTWFWLAGYVFTLWLGAAGMRKGFVNIYNKRQAAVAVLLILPFLWPFVLIAAGAFFTVALLSVPDYDE